MSLLKVEGKVAGTGNYLFRLSYPRSFAVNLRQGKPPVLHIKNDFDCMLGYEGVQPENIHYPADSCNSTLEGILSFFNNNLKDTIPAVFGAALPSAPPTYENISAYSINDVDIIYWKVYSHVFYLPTTGWFEYEAYRRRVRLCCRFFNIKLTGAIDWSFKQLSQALKRGENESV